MHSITKRLGEKFSIAYQTNTTKIVEIVEEHHVEVNIVNEHKFLQRIARNLAKSKIGPTKLYSNKFGIDI